MNILKTTSLYHEPSKSYVEAQIVRLSATMVDEKIHSGWWNDAALKAAFNPEPIDLHWDWHDDYFEFEDRQVPSEKIGILAGENGDVQGAMMLSTEGVPSAMEPGENALFVERLFTAPRNRRDLRLDGKDFLKAVGLELLTWGAQASRDKGCEGRLLLDASPDFVWWYEQKAHLQRVNRNPMLFEGVEYTPMELSASAAGRLLKFWEDA